ncbi:MAG: hypothetical protein PUH36_05225, partial [Subdoligranulum sp.]|nr:hypothetical protein [Subdoligranulum sp.]
ACGVSATGFTQKRHTLYVYYSRGKQKIQTVFACLCALRMFFLIVILLHPQKNRHLPEKQMPICVTLFYA